MRSRIKCQISRRSYRECFAMYGNTLTATVGLLVLSWIIGGADTAFAQNSPIGVDVSHIGDASHVEFSGNKDWKYDLKRDPKKGDRVMLYVPGLKADAIAKLKSHSDALIRSVSVNENGVDGQVEVTFQIAPQADFFDYITEQPSRLVVDFFPKDTPVGTPAAANEKAAPAVSVKPPVPVPSKKSVAEERDPSSDDDDDDTEDAIVAKHLPPKGEKNPRKPAGGDFVLTAKNQTPIQDPLPPKDFDRGIFDGGDPEFKRFSIRDYEVREEAVIASRANFYLPFPMLELGSPHLKALLEAPPIYEIVPLENAENKEARLLLTLFNNKRRAVFLKTAQDFLKKYPKGPYDEIVRYMMADIQYGLWKTEGAPVEFETAMGLYQALIEKFPDSPLTQRTLLLVGYSYIARGDSFGALKTFQRFARMYPQSKHADQVKISISEAFLKLNRFDDAYSILDDIEKTGKTAKARQEAAYRKGDVFFRKRDYPESIKQYKAAIAKYPEANTKFANAWYNIAEAEFSQKHYREGLDAYRAFLQKFPDHDHGGYAMTRVGELLGILGADNKRAFGAFLESYFRYRATPGAGVARIRALTGRMAEMKDKELANALLEIAQITEKYSSNPKRPDAEEEKKKESKKVAAAEKPGEGEGASEHGEPAPAAHGEAAPAAHGETVAAEGGEHGGGGEEKAAADVAVAEHEEEKDATVKRPELPGIEEFSTLLISDGYTARKEFDKAAEELVSFYQKNPQSPNRDKFKARIVRNLTEGIRASVDKGSFIDALRRYSRNSSGWLKNNDRVDLYYTVGRAYEQAGVFKEASNIYRDSLKRLNSIKGTPQEKEHTVFEVLPKADSINLRLAAVAAKEKDFKEAESLLKSVKDQLIEPEQIERAEVAAEVAEARGQGEIARKYLTDLIATWKGDPELTSPLHLRIAKLEAQTKNFKVADAHLAKVLEMRQSSDKVSDDVHAKALELRGDLLLTRGKRAEAVRSYMDLLEAYEAKRPLDSIRYKVGQVLFEDGDLKGAETVWSELKADKDNLWQRLAAEQMRGAKWREEYKKYLNRIPAAADLRGAQSSAR